MAPLVAGHATGRIVPPVSLLEQQETLVAADDS
jgi:hypothetical protein